MLEEEEGDLEDLPGVRCGDSSVGEAMMGAHSVNKLAPVCAWAAVWIAAAVG